MEDNPPNIATESSHFHSNFVKQSSHQNKNVLSVNSGQSHQSKLNPTKFKKKNEQDNFGLNNPLQRRSSLLVTDSSSTSSGSSSTSVPNSTLLDDFLKKATKGTTTLSTVLPHSESIDFHSGSLRPDHFERAALNQLSGLQYRQWKEIKKKLNIDKEIVRYYRLDMINSHRLPFILFALSFLLLLLALILHLMDANMINLRLDYTDCKFSSVYNQNLSSLNSFARQTNLYQIDDQKENDSHLDGQSSCGDLLRTNPGARCECSIEFEVNKSSLTSVRLYYGMDNYYQSNRYLFTSRSYHQLLGNHDRQAWQECYKFDRSINRFNGFDWGDFTPKSDQTVMMTAPCGWMANVMFNDTFAFYWQWKNQNSSFEWMPIPIRRTDISDSMDRNNYGNPAGQEKTFQRTTKPRDWPLPIDQLSNHSQPSNFGYLYEPFNVWMYSAPLPNFVKMYGILQKPPIWLLVQELNWTRSVLPQGRYLLRINYTYPLWSADARKYVLLASSNIFGHLNLELQKFLIIASLIALLSSIFLLVIRCYDIQKSKVLQKYHIKVIF